MFTSIPPNKKRKEKSMQLMIYHLFQLISETVKEKLAVGIKSVVNRNDIFGLKPER